MYTEPLCEKLRRKHLICPAELDNDNTEGLQSYLGQQNFMHHAITAKMIHRWIPTNDFLHKQGHAESHLYLRGCPHQETAGHVLVCGESEAQKQCQTALYKMLHKLV